MTNGRIHSFETFGSVDGPGVRFLVFLSGCGFRCKYCHNPDTWAQPAAREMSADEVLAKVLRYREYWGDEGGITVSGGEPLLQLDFLTELFEKAKEKGVSTCIDTAAGLALPAFRHAAAEHGLDRGHLHEQLPRHGGLREEVPGAHGEVPSDGERRASDRCAWLRKLALTLLRRNGLPGKGVKDMRLECAWDFDQAVKVLFGGEQKEVR